MLLSIKAFFIQLVLRWLDPFVATIILTETARHQTWVAMASLPDDRNWKENRLQWLEWLIAICPYANKRGSEYPKQAVIERLTAAGIVDHFEQRGRPLDAIEIEEWLLVETLKNAMRGYGPSAELLKFAVEAKWNLLREATRAMTDFN